MAKLNFETSEDSHLPDDKVLTFVNKNGNTYHETRDRVCQSPRRVPELRTVPRPTPKT